MAMASVRCPLDCGPRPAKPQCLQGSEAVAGADQANGLLPPCTGLSMVRSRLTEHLFICPIRAGVRWPFMLQGEPAVRLRQSQNGEGKVIAMDSKPIRTDADDDAALEEIATR